MNLESNLDSIGHLVKDVIQYNDQYSIEIQMLRQDKQRIWTNLSINLIKIDNVPNLQVIIQNITDKKRIERDIKNA